MADLLDVVDELTLSRPKKLETDDGFMWVTEEPLLVQLEEAIRSTTGRTGGRSTSHARSILDDDALMQFHKITSTIGSWCRMVGAKVTRNPVVDLRAWHAARLSSNDPDTFYLRELRSWVALIRGKLTPLTEWEWEGPCPLSDANEWVNDEGETITHPVRIEFDPERVMATVRWRCHACNGSQAGEFAQRFLAHDAETREKPE